MGRGPAVALSLLLLVSFASAPALATHQSGPCAAGSACENYARAQVDNRIAQLNITQNLLKLLITNLTDNGRSIAYLSINGTLTSRHGLAVWEQVTQALTDTSTCPDCPRNFSQGLSYYGNNSSALSGNFNGTTGRAALAREQTEYLQDNPNKAGHYAGGITAIFRDAMLLYVETQKAIYSNLGI